MSRVGQVLVPFAGILALWYLAIWIRVPFGGAPLPNFILPAPERVAETLWLNRALLLEHSLTTFGEKRIDQHAFTQGQITRRRGWCAAPNPC
ncbi:MAG: hypothetical protein AAGH74_11655 [Pseudomonadota bacterium]